MKFGTDGFRGRADESITPDFCLKLGFHTGTIIKNKGYDSIILGKDTRVSGYMLEAALQAGFISAGVDVKLAGPIPTPAVSFLTATYSGQFGVVISASHNPFYDNGIKFFNKYGRKISIPDALIAAFSKAYNLELFTLNTKDFRNIDGIKIYKTRFQFKYKKIHRYF